MVKRQTINFGSINIHIVHNTQFVWGKTRHEKESKTYFTWQKLKIGKKTVVWITLEWRLLWLIHILFGQFTNLIIYFNNFTKLDHWNGIYTCVCVVFHGPWLRTVQIFTQLVWWLSAIIVNLSNLNDESVFLWSDAFDYVRKCTEVRGRKIM